LIICFNPNQRSAQASLKLVLKAANLRNRRTVSLPQHSQQILDCALTANRANPACRKLKMSASARKLGPKKLVVALSLAGTLLVVVSLNALGLQNDSVSAAQVTEMIAQVRATSAAQAPTAGAFQLGRRLLIEARYGEAYELFTALLEKWPREPEALYGAALSSFNLGHPADAEPLARAASEVYLAGVGDRPRTNSALPNQIIRGADAIVLLAVIQGARGEDTEALKSARRAVALAPGHFDAQFILGRASYGVGDSATAVGAFRAALKLKPDDARSLFFLATALESAGNTDAALDAYRDLIRLQPQAAEGHLGLGVLLTKRGGVDARKGIEELRTTVRIDPNQYEAQVTLGRALLTEKLATESVEHLKRAAELAPNNPEPHYQLALAYRRLGLNDKAAAETAIVKRIHEARRGDGTQNNTARPNQ
jgi:tetratricopeptide (TPR) repeat protein